MECHSEQTYALLADGELAADEARRLREHLATCWRCQKLVDALRAENHVLIESLNELPEEAASPAGFSARRWSLGWGDLAIMAALLALGSIISGWFNELSIPAALEWFNPFSQSGRTNLLFQLFYYFAHGGTAMLADYAAVVGWICLLLLLGGSALLLGRRGRLRRPGLRLLIVLLTLSLPGLALDRRHADFVTVAANETVDDTLVAAASIVRVDGVVNGDLIAIARTVEVRGTIKGDLITAASRTEVSGTVEGNIYTLSHTLELYGQLDHSIYGVVQSLHVDDRGHVGQGVVMAAGDANLEGEVKRSVNMVISESGDVSGHIGRDLTMIGSDQGGLTLTETARVGGNLSAHVRQLKNVHIADGAVIAGKRDIQLNVRESRFTRPRFYVHQALWLAGAMLVGWLGLLLFPGFFQAATQSVGSGWRSLGLGFAVLVGAPVAMIVIAITLVGLPVSIILFEVYLAGIYLAKVWVGAFLGRTILRPSGATKGDWVLGLLVGLLILTAIGFIPYLGGLVHFGVVCLGLGAFAAQLYRASRPAMTA
ncbi:MAG: zf-HC2 domain-containing protein [Terriglobales bacterium]